MDGVDDECSPAVKARGSIRMSQSRDSVTFAFHIETLRLVAFSAFLCVLLSCAALTSLFVTVPHEETVIYRIFGFNHACNLLDHHPAREVGAILQIFMIFPLALFHGLSLLQAARAYKAREVPRWFLRYCQATTPYNVLASGWSYMWFVNPPMGEYGFVAHYIPYLCFQVMLALMVFQQVVYYSYMGSVPFIVDVPPRWGFAYAAVFAAFTTFATACIISMLAGSPILDSVHNPSHRVVFQGMNFVYTVLIFVPPIISSVTARRRRSDLVVLTFGVASQRLIGTWCPDDLPQAGGKASVLPERVGAHPVNQE